MLILVAAVSIGIAAVQRLLTPKPLELIGLGIGVSIVASFSWDDMALDRTTAPTPS
jgi:divalent metal cation (Fe/Co/Zn/Cd) transporter